MKRGVLLLVMSFVPAVGEAQSSWDIAGTAGLFAGHTPRVDGAAGYQDTWFHNLQGGIVLGRYVTPHLKLEIEATNTTEAAQYRDRNIHIPGYPYPYPIGSEVVTTVRSVSAAATWQFRENEWVHPFVQAGVSTDFDRVTVRTWEQFFYGEPRGGSVPQRLVEESLEGPTTVRHTTGVLGGGAKVYLAEKAFIRTEGRWSFGRARQQLAFRVGAGVDF